MNTLQCRKHRSTRSTIPTSVILSGGIGVIFSLGADAGLPIPQVPLQTGSSVPANVWFVLDDSGSMARSYMPDDVLDTTPIDISLQTYVRNGIFYNPAVTYRPWRKADGSFYPITPATAAYGSDTAASGTISLTASDQIFYVPKVGITDLADARQYYRYRLRSSGSMERCTSLALSSGVWTWQSCSRINSETWATSSGTITRSYSQELQNYATWYSYSRTRTKVAKSGASLAFSGLGETIRVGFTTIWNRNTFPIPVASDNGLFRNYGGSSNRTEWFNRLFAAGASGTTPLRSALRTSGEYFSKSDSSGPYGPESGDAQLACRQNFTILTTDGFWNGDSGFSQSDADSTIGPTVEGPNNLSYRYSPSRPYMDGRADTLADVAMANWVRDLRSDLPNIVPSTPADPGFWQHSVTFGLSIGLKGTLNPDTDLPALTTGAKSWPDPTANEDATRIDDLWHASINGRGKFVAATNSEQFAQGLKDALSTITARVSSSSNVSTSTTSISTDSQAFQASFIGGQWTGELAAYQLTASGFSAIPNWLASQQVPVASSRNIFTWNGSEGAEFPTSAQTTALTVDIAAFVRGDDSKEIQNGGTFRDRLSLLGDIINSSPVYVNDSGGTVYIGANDGMLHAFDARSGRERFAYLPGGVNLADLKLLSDPSYAHRHFVDGPLVVSSTDQTPGKRILVGALGRGGPGMFGLDVTNGGSFGAASVLWDRPSIPELGVLLSTPFIAKLNNGSAGVVVGNGPNSVDERAILVVIDAQSGSTIRTLDTGAGSATAPNGLSAPRGWDIDTDGIVDYVYAGDLQGNVWKFDLTGSNPSQWKISNSGAPLFVAKSAGGVRQPITGGMTVGKDPETFDTWISVGTGRYLIASDMSDKSVQTWYGLIDKDATITGRSVLKQRKIVAVGTISGTIVRGFENSVTGDMEGKKGWYLDFVEPPTFAPEGERMVGDALLFGRAIIAASIVPNSNACEVGGSGYINAIDAFTGAALSSSLFDIDGNGDFAELVPGSPGPGGASPVGSFNPGVGLPTTPILVGGVTPGTGSGAPITPAPGSCPPGTHMVLVNGSDGTPAWKCVDTGNTQGRISWREIIKD